MIGQRNNIEFIIKCIDDNKLPRFMLIQGDAGSGKKTFVQEIAKLSNYELVWFASSVEGVRNLIDLCYTQTKPIIYAISDCDKLSNTAMNALLKVAEEPPTNAYIVLTFCADTLLPTIKSRGTLIIMEPYSRKDKQEFMQSINAKDFIEHKLDIADNFGELLVFDNIDFENLSSFCDNITANIGKANVGSVLKISKKIKLREKDDDSLFDVNIFIKVLLFKFYQLFKRNHDERYFRSWVTINSARKDLSKSYSKQAVIDCMLLDLWSIWNNKENK